MKRTESDSQAEPVFQPHSLPIYRHDVGPAHTSSKASYICPMLPTSSVYYFLFNIKSHKIRTISLIKLASHTFCFSCMTPRRAVYRISNGRSKRQIIHSFKSSCGRPIAYSTVPVHYAFWNAKNYKSMRISWIGYAAMVNKAVMRHIHVSVDVSIAN